MPVISEIRALGGLGRVWSRQGRVYAEVRHIELSLLIGDTVRVDLLFQSGRWDVLGELDGYLSD